MIIQETLENGIRVIAEKMDGLRSCALGVWVGTGSAYELADEAGISHFIEHMLFKGTEKRSARDIAVEMDSIGGSINAFTSKECTCYYCKVLDEHLTIAVDVLSDIVMHSVFDPKEIEKEQGVVSEEILMVEDSPEDLAHDTIASVYYDDDPLGKPILGTEESVRSFTRENLIKYMGRQYVPSRVVVAAAGNFDETMLVSLIKERFAGMKPGTALPISDNKAPGGKRFVGVEKDIEQIHICMAMPGTAMDTCDQYPLYVLNNALGGSMSSRLFQKIREQRGLAYSIYSYLNCYRSEGSFSLYAGTGEGQAADVIALMAEELDLIRRAGITPEELERSRSQLKGSCLLGQEGTSSRMNALGKTALLLNRRYDANEVIRRIENVNMDDIMRIVPNTIDKENMSTVCVGRVKCQEPALRAYLHV
ncbi:MAG: insulinase family protein [Clostridiales bacterium]|jgi:predicted Zn-dependent peptidase|nr:insulinase family protein [Clostridiales bacterium]